MLACLINTILESQLFAAVVGALLTLLGGFLVYWLRLRHERKKKREEYLSWISSLSAELIHIDECINEITGIVQGGNPSTKRMNGDFLEQARLIIFNYDNDESFLVALTKAYRDVIHTNDMLDRYEKETEPGRSTNQGNVLKSIEGVKKSISDLQNKLSKKRNSK